MADRKVTPFQGTHYGSQQANRHAMSREELDALLERAGSYEFTQLLTNLVLDTMHGVGRHAATSAYRTEDMLSQMKAAAIEKWGEGQYLEFEAYYLNPLRAQLYTETLETTAEQIEKLRRDAVQTPINAYTKRARDAQAQEPESFEDGFLATFMGGLFNKK